MIRFKCPTCGGSVKCPDEYAGQTGKCHKCSSQVAIPFESPIAVIKAPEPIVVSRPMPADEVDCPFCGEMILGHAKKCKHCGEILDPTLRAKSALAAPHAAPVSIVNSVHQTTVVHRGQRWSRGTAMALSFLIPGLGQFYKGQPINAFIWFMLTAVGYVAFIIPGICLHLCCIAGAGMGSND